MKKLLYVAMLFFVIAMTCGNVEQAEAKTYKAGKFKYTYKKTKKGVWITKITPLSSKGISKLNIPAKIKGKKVVKLGSTKDENTGDLSNTRVPDLFGVVIADYDGYKSYTLSGSKIHKRVAKIKKIKIPSHVTSITPKCFINMQDGKEINIPKGLKKNIPYQFTKPKWKKLKISSKHKKYKVKNACLLSKSGKTVYGIVQKRKKVVLPNTVTKIAHGPYSGKGGQATPVLIHRYAFSGCETLVIPKSVKDIFCLKTVDPIMVLVDSQNQYYAAQNGTLYNKKTGKLMTVYSTDGVYNIPHGVKEIPIVFYTFGTNSAKKMIIPSTVKKVGNLLAYFHVEDAICECYAKEAPLPNMDWVDYTNLNGMNMTVYIPKGSKASYEKTWDFDKKQVRFTFIEQ